MRVDVDCNDFTRLLRRSFFLAMLVAPPSQQSRIIESKSVFYRPLHHCLGSNNIMTKLMMILPRRQVSRDTQEQTAISFKNQMCIQPKVSNEERG